MSVEIAAPIIPYGGISTKLSPMLTSAAPPVITQLNCVFFARPIPIDITLKAMNAVPPKTSSGTTSSARWNLGVVNRLTSHGASSESASESQLQR